MFEDGNAGIIEYGEAVMFLLFYYGQLSYREWFTMMEFMRLCLLCDNFLIILLNVVNSN